MLLYSNYFFFNKNFKGNFPLENQTGTGRDLFLVHTTSLTTTTTTTTTTTFWKNEHCALASLATLHTTTKWQNSALYSTYVVISGLRATHAFRHVHKMAKVPN